MSKFVWDKFDTSELIGRHALWSEAAEVHQQVDRLCRAHRRRIELAAYAVSGYAVQRKAAYAEARAVLAEHKVIPTNTCEGKPCGACQQPHRAVAYYKNVDGEARIVYRCGCDSVFISCETRQDFQRANGRKINRCRW